jgi:type I restriction enzyme S subunit
MVRFPKAKISEIDSRYFVEPGDLVISMTGDVKLAFNKSSERFLLNQRVGKIYIHLASARYICLLLETQAKEKIEQASGSVISNVSTEEINNSVISLPPLAEQHRIVAKVDELMTLCDTLEAQQADAESAHARLVQALLDSLTQTRDAQDFAAHWQRLSAHFDTLFTTESSIDALKQTLLQLAVMGKLVPQDPSDESADYLLRLIADKKAQLQARGVIKGQMALGSVSEEEKFIELPKGWCWVRLGEVCRTQTGATPSKSQPEYFGSDVPFIKPGDIYATSVDYDGEGLSALGAAKSGRIAGAGSLLMVCIGTIGKCNIIDKDCSFNQQINSATLYGGFSSYLLIAVRSSYFQARAWKDSSSTTIAILNKGKWEAIPIPLPGVAEQHRIVAKVDELMALCDQLKTRLRQARDLNQQLATTLVERAVA